MKTRLILTLLAVAVATGCATQKPTGSKEAVAQATISALHAEALSAIEARRFKIEADGEFYFNYIKKRTSRTPLGHAPVKSSAKNELSLNGTHALLVFSPDLFPGVILDQLRIEDHKAQVVDMKCKKNGNVDFTLLIRCENPMRDRDVVITLYKNSNKCLVVVNHGQFGPNIVSFKGTLLPLAD